MILVAGCAWGCGEPGSGATSTPQSRRVSPDEAVAAIRDRVRRFRIVMPEDVETLKDLARSHPDHGGVRRLLEHALVQHQDWNALVRLRSATPVAGRTPKEEYELAKLLFKAQRFDEAVAVAAPLLDAAPENTDIRWLVGHSLFYSGDPAESARVLDARREALVAAGHTDALLLRGLIHLQADEPEAAIEVLRELLRLDPESVSGRNAMGRALSAVGRVEEAQDHFRESDRLRARLNEVEARQARLASRVLMFEQAWKDRRFDDCETLLSEALVDCDDASKPKLLRYLSGVYHQTGRADLAAATLRQADALE